MRGFAVRLFITVFLLGTSVGCSYRPISDRGWTLQDAKQVILEHERRQVCGFGPIKKDSIEVTDEYFTDFYLASDFATTGYQGGQRYQTYQATYKLRRIYYREIADVRAEVGILDTFRGQILGVMFLGTCVFCGPYWYQLYAVTRGGSELHVGPCDHVELNALPLWPLMVRPAAHSDDYGEALLFMARRAGAGPQEPTELAKEAD